MRQTARADVKVILLSTSVSHSGVDMSVSDIYVNFSEKKYIYHFSNAGQKRLFFES